MSRTVVFVFGSNTEGRHGAGSAKEARMNWGAQYGKAIGRVGNSYAVVTKDLSIGKRSVPLNHIKEQLLSLKYHIQSYPDDIFIISPIGCGLAGYTVQEIRDLIDHCAPWPSNVYFNSTFINENKTSS